MLMRFPVVQQLDLLLIRADTKMRVGTLLVLMGFFALFPVAVALLVLKASPVASASGLVFGFIPVLWLRYKKAKRVRTFERQFPDALDILTSALRSGMAFSGAVQVVSEECAETVAKEFTILFEENRLGIDMAVALRSLADRVDSKELHLFVIAVLLQKDTGGNLVEILEGTAFVIRDRLRILGDVRALTAQARLSGVILSVLPVAVAMFIMVTAPDYMRVLFKEQTGRNLLFTAIALQVIGFLIMRRIATIKV
jgi:tight adherence protein B